MHESNGTKWETTNIDDLPAPAEIQTTLLALIHEFSVTEMFSELEASLQAAFSPPSIKNFLEVLPVLASKMTTAHQNEKTQIDDFLQYINLRLREVLIGLEQTIGGDATQRSAVLELSDMLQESIFEMQTHLKTPADWKRLQSQVTTKLDNIMQVMHRYQEKQYDRMGETIQTINEMNFKLNENQTHFRRLEDALVEQKKSATRDPLTQLPNRRAYNAYIERCQTHFQENGGLLHLSLLDIDHFKQINDTYGHLAGDAVLRSIAHVFIANLRETDFVARIGGEEFALVTLQVSLDVTKKIVEKLRKAVEQTTFSFEGITIPVTLSAGISNFQLGDTIEQVFARADKNLYQAKNTGRNRFCSDE